MIKTKDPLECTVLTLVLGHIEGKFFLTPSIANFLGIDKDQINTIVKSGILEFKEVINKKIDMALDVIQSDEPNQYIKTLGGKGNERN